MPFADADDAKREGKREMGKNDWVAREMLYVLEWFFFVTKQAEFFRSCDGVSPSHSLSSLILKSGPAPYLSRAGRLTVLITWEERKAARGRGGGSGEYVGLAKARESTRWQNLLGIFIVPRKANKIDLEQNSKVKKLRRLIERCEEIIQFVEGHDHLDIIRCEKAVSHRYRSCISANPFRWIR